MARENESKILAVLIEEPATFTELLHKTGLSRGTLSQHLKNLAERGLIRREYDEGRRAVVIKPYFSGDFIARGELPPQLLEKLEDAERNLRITPDEILGMPPKKAAEFLDKWFINSIHLLKTLFIFALAPPIPRNIAMEGEQLESFLYDIMRINFDICRSKSEPFMKNLAFFAARSADIAEYLRRKALSIIYEEIERIR